jgi:DNA-directed RNA polymerase specialized sigma24 family protein
MDFERSTAQLRDGRITFAEYAAATGERWEATARWLMRRTRLPGWVEPRDVVQELLAAAWRAVWEYCPERGGMPVGRYVRVAAINVAKKKLNKVRGGDRTWVGPSNIDVPFSTMSAGELLAAEESMSTPAEHDDEAARAAEAAMPYCESVEEQLIMQALACCWSIVGAAELVYRDEDKRRQLGLWSPDHAEHVVVEVASKLARKIELARAA